MAAAGGGLAANLAVLAAGFSARTGVDRAGEVFGLGYQDAAKSLLKAAAAAVNACLKCGALIQQGASNYSKAEVASTLGGAGGVLEAPSLPAEFAAPGPPGTMGPGEPPPLLWSIVESLVLESWPDGDVPGLHAAASRWRDFAGAANGVQRTLNGSKTLLDAQHLPEGDKIEKALNEIGSAAATIGEKCGELATAIDKFADKVDHAQHAVRDLLDRLGSLGDLGHDDRYLEELRQVDAAKVQEVAAKYFDLSRMALTVMVPEKEKDFDLKPLFAIAEEKLGPASVEKPSRAGKSGAVLKARNAATPSW